MNNKTLKSILGIGTPVQISLPNGETIATKIQMVENRYLWVPELLEEGQWQTHGSFLIIHLTGASSNISFKAVYAGRGIISGVPLMKFVAVTQPADDNRRESFRLYKLFDLSVERKFEKPGEACQLQCQGLDISDTGLGFASAQWFQYGEMIECCFNLNGALYRLTAKVVRVIKQKTDMQEDIYRVGAMFIRAGDNTRKKIRRYIYLQQTARRKRMKKEELK